MIVNAFFLPLPEKSIINLIAKNIFDWDKTKSISAGSVCVHHYSKFVVLTIENSYNSYICNSKASL